MIELEHIRTRQGGRTVLDEVSFSVSRREIVGLIGPPEAGKTTLLKTLAALVPPEAGAIVADGEPIGEVTSWQSRIGMSFQNDALFDAMSVFDNVAFPLRRRRLHEDEVHTRVMQRLEQVGLAAAAPRFPADISGGMRKRVGIARATVIEPELGLFDDPVAGLDPVTASLILELIVTLTSALSMATVIVSNDLPVLLPICSRVVMLNAGRVVFDGAVAELVRCERREVVQFVTGADEGPL